MLILASNSPRRRQLLGLLNIPFQVKPVWIDENSLPGETPQDYVRRIALGKAQVASRQCEIDDLILAADTIVVHDGKIFGKPRDAQEAGLMLQNLRHESHQVITALVVLRKSDSAWQNDACVTEVTMRDYTDNEMEAYITSGDPMDKAGAYAIQHVAFHPVKSIQGCYTNVVGLPLCRVAKLFQAFGISLPANSSYSCLTAVVDACSFNLDSVYAL
jgi:septum formation protein